METGSLHNIWNNIDSEIKLKTIEELNHSLAARTRQTMNKFLAFLVLDIVVCIGVIIFLIITALNRRNDSFYLANNTLLCLITLTSLIVSVFVLNKLHNNRYNLPLKEWVEQRIKLLSKWLLGKFSRSYIVLLPVLLALMEISIHVYYENKPMTEVIKDTGALTGLIVGFVVGLAVSFYSVSKIRKFQLKNLEFLKELHADLCRES
jgi:hypothetical protein